MTYQTQEDPECVGLDYNVDLRTAGLFIYSVAILLMATVQSY